MSEKSTSRKSVVVSEAVQRRVKARAAELGRSVKAVVEEALTAWLEGPEPSALRAEVAHLRALYQEEVQRRLEAAGVKDVTVGP